MPRSTDTADADHLTRRLAASAGAWVLPFWLERQADPDSPSFSSTGAGATNVSHRERTPVGTLGSERVATVDPRGLVTPWPGGWSLDWWVGADDRWHLPSREVAVRQSLLGDAPVVETAMRVPGGDVVQRVWAFHDADAGDVLAVEVENASRVPVALALVVRPYGPDGAARVTSASVADRVVRVDGRTAAWLPKAPSRVAASTFATGDVADVVLHGSAPEQPSVTTTCADGLAQLAVVVPLAHTASIRVLVPLDPAAGAVEPTAVPPPDAVARGWTTHAGRATRLEIPDAELASVFAAARAGVLLASTGRTLTGGDVRETAALVGALDRCGLHDEADAIVATLPDGQGAGARLGGADESPWSTGAALFAAGRHWALGREDALVGALAGPMAAGAHHRPGTGRLGRKPDAPLGALGTAWQLAGSLAAARALRAVGQAEASREVERRSADLVAAVGDLFTADGRPTADEDLLSLLDLVAPLGLLSPADARAQALLDRVRARATHGPAALQRGAPAGLSPERTARLAQAELRRGDRTALDRLRWLVEAGGSTRGWPTIVHPRTGGGISGSGWSAGAAAAVVDVITDLFAVTDGTSALVLCPVLPDGWLGAGFEVHGLATEAGVLSYAVRWHGERPALLWEVVPHDAHGTIRLTAPGLDPSWSTTELRGDALLDRPPTAPVHAMTELTAAAESIEPEAPEPGPSEGQSFG